MKISRSTGYALIAACYIAKSGKPTVMASEAAEAYNLPLEYLLKLLQDLTKFGILGSKRGPRGGFYLARKPENISMLDIIEAAEGSLAGPPHITEQTNEQPFGVFMDETCREAAEAARKVLKKTTMAKILKLMPDITAG